MARQLGGYVRRDKPKAVEPVEAKKREPRKRVPIPPGLREAIQAKEQLELEIEGYTRMAFTVTVDMENQEWFLTVRGWEPFFEYWGGYRIKFQPSHLVRNPLSRRRV